jgi:hypothetical protein
MVLASFKLCSWTGPFVGALLLGLLAARNLVEVLLWQEKKWDPRYKIIEP